MWRNIASNALSLFVVGLFVLGGLLAWGQTQFKAAGPLAQTICLKVAKGASFRVVAEKLVAQGAVSSGMIFRLGADYSGRAGQLKFGSYLVPPNASMDAIVALVSGDGQSTCGVAVNYRIGVTGSDIVVLELDNATNILEEVAKFVPGVDSEPAAFGAAMAETDVRMQVTLAEGVTSWQVVEALKAVDFLNGEVAEVPAEGSLAPLGYEIERGSERVALLAQMAAVQARVLADLWVTRAEGLPVKTPEEALVLASLVEKETGVVGERPLVASVFVNRLREGMRLQTDPAVIYGITKGAGVLGRGLKQSELRKATLYNTYIITGLPPTPIANPGRASIEAALHPATSKFLFFVADGTGGHAFAETLAEHNENVARWRVIEADRAANPETVPAGDGTAAP